METDQSYRIGVHLADLQEIHGRLDHEGKKTRAGTHHLDSSPSLTLTVLSYATVTSTAAAKRRERNPPYRQSCSARTHRRSPLY